MDFSPSTEIATGGNVIPNVSGVTAGGGAAAGGGATAAPTFGAAATDPAYLWGGQAVPGMTAGGAPITGGMVPPGATAPGIMDQLGSAFGGVGSAVKSAAPWLGAAGMGYNLFQGYQSQQALKALQQQQADYQNRIAAAGQASLQAAQPELAAGMALQGLGGNVPAPMQAMLDRFRNSLRARVIQSYGGQNLSTDPTKNTMLAQDLNAVDTQVQAMEEQMGKDMVDSANRMLASGASATEIASELPLRMQELDMQLQKMAGNAIANFASAMSGGSMRAAGLGTGQNINLNLSGLGGTPTGA
jgi:hypothetical protein